MSLFTFGDLEPYTNYENSNGQNILVNIFNPFSGFTTPSVIQPSHTTTTTTANFTPEISDTSVK